MGRGYRPFIRPWYSVSAVNDPFILHETFIQVYIQNHFKDGSSSWFALTHDEDFELSPQNTYQYNDNKTIVISYLTGSPQTKAITVPLSERRLLTPQPMPAIELSKLPAPVINGATDYLLLPNDVIDPGGDECDAAGVSYKAFALQPDRCNVPKDTCLKNQPLDFWDEDNDKRSAGAKGDYLLENFGIPYKDPIIVDPETKEHWLALEYHEQHRTVIIVEVNADEINILTVGKVAQISKMTSSIIKNTINVRASVLNGGLMPAKFAIQAVKCAYGVPDSNKESIVIPPQMTEDVLITTKPGGTELDEKFDCTVQVSSELYGVIAEREVTINPRARCICNFHCECACMSDSLKCELMDEEDYQAAGFRGSLPILTAKPPYRIWFVAHPFLALLAIILFLLLIGLIKSICGIIGWSPIGNFGMDKVFYRPGKIKKYPQANLKHLEIVYDDEGYPINPDTRERIKVVSDELLPFFNLVFMFFWPCMMCQQCCKKTAKLQRKWTKKNDDDGDDSGDTEDKKDTRDKHSLISPLKETRMFKKLFGKKDKDSIGKDSTGKDSTGQKVPTQNMAAKISKSDVEKKTHKEFHQPKHSVTVSKSEEIATTGPAADPLNKERQRWQKGKTKIDVVTGK